MNTPRSLEDAEIWRPSVVHQITGFSDSTRYRMEKRGDFPKRIRLSTNSVGYRAREVRDWLAKLPQAVDAPIESPNPRRKSADRSAA